MNSNDSSNFFNDAGNIFLNVLYFVMTVYAIFMSFRRNNGFHFGSFLAAVLFTPLYIVYTLAVPNKNKPKGKSRSKSKSKSKN